MNAIPFDTHRVVKRLQQAGFSEPQAETVTDVLREARDTSMADIATKADLMEVRTELKAETAAVKADVEQLRITLRAEMQAGFSALRADMAKGQADTLKWIFGMVVVQGGVVFALLRLFPGH